MRSETEPRADGAGGSSLPAIAPPRSGGGFQGLTAEFRTGQFSGTASVALPLPISPCAQGGTPSLRLGYDSGNGNGAFGVGWALDRPSVRRMTRRGVPRYRGLSDPMELTGLGEIVPERALAGQAGTIRTEPADGAEITLYRARTEGAFSRIERIRELASGAVHWRTLSAANVQRIYGRTPAARIADPADPGRVFEWLLEEERHPNGARTRYVYAAEDGRNLPADDPSERARRAAGLGHAQRYLQQVLYGNRAEGVADAFRFRLVFDYGGHDAAAPEPDGPGDWIARADPFSDARPGFELRTWRLCQRVLMFHHFPEALGAAPCLVRSLRLEYDRSPVLTRLVGAELSGHVRLSEAPPLYRTRSFPRTAFGYAEARLADAPHIVTPQPLGWQVAAEWADLDGEGIEGVLERAGALWCYRRPVAPGGGAIATTEEGVPLARSGPPAELAPAGRVQSRPAGQGPRALADLAGDGRLDLLRLEGPGPALAERDRDFGWSAERRLTSAPKLDPATETLRRADLTGDGRADLLVAGRGPPRWHAGLGEAGFGPPQPLSFAGPGPPPDLAARAGDRLVTLTDFTGDGLADITCISWNRVEIWPGLGHGRFGPGRVLPLAEPLAPKAAFRPGRVLLGDVDGTGTADLVYLGRHGISVHRSHAGNGFAAPHVLRGVPPVDRASDVALQDVLGRGTAALVWSSSHPRDHASGLRVLDPMPEGKPYLLVRIDNGIGGRTLLHHRPSTEFYLRDRAVGRRWRRPPPSPMHVVERTVREDRVTGARYATVYSYHDGCYDEHERAVCGFGEVRRWDSDGLPAPGAEAPFRTPTGHRRTWYHTGIEVGGDAGASATERGYRLPADPVRPRLDLLRCRLPAGLTPDDRRDALRALRGTVLRHETYGAGPAAGHGAGPAAPVAVSVSNAAVRQLQPRAGPHPGAYLTVPEQTLSFQLEDEPDDRRVVHALVLGVDGFGTVTDRARVHYPRRAPAIPEQGRLSCILSRLDVIHRAEGAALRLLALPSEERSFEVTGLSWSWADAPDWLSPDDFGALLADPDDAVAFEDAPPPDRPAKRLLGRTRTYYRADDALGTTDPDSTGAMRLPLGVAGDGALPYERYRAAFSAALAEQALGPLFTTEGAFAAGYHVEPDVPGLFWIPSGRAAFGPFRQPFAARDPFGAVSTVADDAAGLPRLAVDPLGNAIEGVNDLRVLAAATVRDANGQAVQVTYDALGYAVGSAVVGRDGEGDSLEGFVADLDETPEIGPEGVPKPARLLGRATTRTVHDVHRFRRLSLAGAATGPPSAVLHLQRERHGGDDSPVRQAIAYIDGMGRNAGTKTEAEPAPAPDAPDALPAAPRWRTVGRVLRDNKGNPVRRFEAFFSATALWDSDAAAASAGVAAVVGYDALGRVRRVDHPDGTVARTDYATWEITEHDRGDTVLDSAWYRARGAPDPAAAMPEAATVRAAWASAQHARTPVRRRLDPRGDAVLDIADLGGGVLVETRTELDALGNATALIDAHGTAVERTRYDMAGRALALDGRELGLRRSWRDAAGKPVLSLDAAGTRNRTVYDAAQRPLALFVQEADGEERLASLTVYGEAHPEAVERNLCGRVFRRYDAAGVTTLPRYDFKGRVPEGQRRLARGYAETVFWDALSPGADIAATATAAEPFLEPEIHVERRSFDALDRTVEEELADGSRLGLGYDAGLGLATVDVVLPGESPVRYVQGIERDARGRRRRIALGNGVTTRYDYDPLSFRLTRLVSERSAPAAVLQDIAYVHDALGQIVEIEDRAQPVIFAANRAVTPQRRFAYDALGRQVLAEGREHPAHQAAPPGGGLPPIQPLPHPNDLGALGQYTETFAYDALGNLLSVEHSGTAGSWRRAYDYHPGSNRLRAVSRPGDPPGNFGDAVAHDANGAVVGLAHLTVMRRDAAGRLQATARTATATGTPQTTYYVHDETGARIRKVTERAAGPGQTPTRQAERICLGACEIYREYAADGIAVTLERHTLHVRDDHARVAVIDRRIAGAEAAPARSVRFQLGDHLGSAVLQLDGAGAVIDYVEFHAYGTVALACSRSLAETSLKRHFHAGLEVDGETGFQYHGTRYYAPVLGRFLSGDPAGVEGGINLYEYAGSAPIRLSDPGGLAPAEPPLIDDHDGIRPYDAVGPMGESDVVLSEHHLEGDRQWALEERERRAAARYVPEAQRIRGRQASDITAEEIWDGAMDNATVHASHVGVLFAVAATWEFLLVAGEVYGLGAGGQAVVAGFGSGGVGGGLNSVGNQLGTTGEIDAAQTAEETAVGAYGGALLAGGAHLVGRGLSRLVGGRADKGAALSAEPEASAVPAAGVGAASTPAKVRDTFNDALHAVPPKPNCTRCVAAYIERILQKIESKAGDIWPGGPPNGSLMTEEAVLGFLSAPELNIPVTFGPRIARDAGGALTEPGHYVIFNHYGRVPGYTNPQPEHVLVSWVTKDGRQFFFDPQPGRLVTADDVGRYVAYRFFKSR